MNYGYKKPVFDFTKDYQLGGFTKVPAEILRPDGQWDAYLPTDEFQSLHFETNNCTAFATTNCIEAIMRRRMNPSNYSDRFLGIVAGTTEEGNDPNTVAEAWRKNGAVDENDLPMTQTLAEYYKPRPMTEPYVSKGKDWLAKWKLRHEYVPGDAASMKEALTYSPLGAAVSAWSQVNGLYVRFREDNHWITIYGYEDGKYWKAFDSYDNTHKKLSWDFTFGTVKRYSVTVNDDLSILEQIVSLYSQVVSFLTVWLTEVKPLNDAETPVIVFEKPKENRIHAWADAIQIYEGYAPGTRSYRNRNPGNLKYTSYTRTLGPTGFDKQNFCIFPTVAVGYAALCTFLSDAAKGELGAYRGVDLYGFFNRYCPASDGNKPKHYAEYVSQQISVSPYTKIANLT